MPTLTDLKARLDELNRDFRRPRIPPLELSKPYDLTTDWRDYWPGTDSAGVYVFVGAKDEVLRIGKASCGETIGSRLGHYFGSGPDGKAEPYDDAYREVHRVLTIALPQDHEFEAPAIEEFLISRVGPRLNKTGRRAAPEDPIA